MAMRNAAKSGGKNGVKSQAKELKLITTTTYAIVITAVVVLGIFVFLTIFNHQE